MDHAPTPSETGDATERRRSPRMTVALPARVVGDGWSREVATVDLSEDGVLLSGADFPSATRVRLEIELAELGWRSLVADVVRREERGQGAGERLAATFARAATEGGRSAIREFFAARLEDGARRAA
ncbi:MAG TPA: PilZ domain-containing protein [Miltoncostaeaceae bacterium]|nr:PilZ domain-containing protein [Miltoncostaeaceae bacterium]